MTPGGLLHDLAFDYTLRTVALGSAILGLVSGALGTFAVLRRQSLLGDTVSHTALPGIALAFLLTGSKAPLVLLLGAAAAGWLGTLLVVAILRTTRLKSDSAFGIVLSVFFGFGLVLLTFIQKRPDARQAGLEKFLFGQATALLTHDVAVMTVVGAILLAVVAILYKELKLATFDHDFGLSLGLPMHRIDILLTSALVVAVVLGLQTVGVVLMSAMVVAPAAAARQWTDRLGRMIVLAAFFGALAGVGGAVASSLTSRMPTGPVIVLCASAIVLVSLTLAPGRGLLWSWLRRLHNRRRLALDAVLLDLYELSRQHADRAHPHALAALEAMSQRGGVARSLATLAERGLVRAASPDAWSLTPAGGQEAERRIAALGRQP
jgi:manganese/zinc/iron transport system permease protein